MFFIISFTDRSLVEKMRYWIVFSMWDQGTVISQSSICFQKLKWMVKMLSRCTNGLRYLFLDLNKKKYGNLSNVETVWESCMKVVCSHLRTSLFHRIMAHQLSFSVGVEPGTLRFRIEVITNYTTLPQLIDYMLPKCSMSRGDRAMHCTK